MARQRGFQIMLTATAYEFGWKTVLLAIATKNRDLRVAGEASVADRSTVPVSSEQDTDDVEAFHLDDTEIADRLSPNRTPPTHPSAPGRGHLVFPMLGYRVR